MKTIDGIKRYYCKHPFKNTVFVYKHYPGIDSDMQARSRYPYTVNIRKCLFCERHFIDEGFEIPPDKLTCKDWWELAQDKT